MMVLPWSGITKSGSGLQHSIPGQKPPNVVPDLQLIPNVGWYSSTEWTRESHSLHLREILEGFYAGKT